MDVSSSNLQLKGKVGLTPAVVYLATVLTHHTRVVEESGKLVLRSRTQSAEDRTVAPGWVLSTNDRITSLKAALPSWFVHDALSSVFAGSRAYEAVNERVWKEFGQSKTVPTSRVLRTANLMFDFPHIGALEQAFHRLWKLELSVMRTPKRRRVSDTGAVLFRAAYSHLKVHDHQIDHVIPIGKGMAAAKMQLDIPYPLNHVANLMPVPTDINSDRGDEPWSDYHWRLSEARKKAVSDALMVPWESTAISVLSSIDVFCDFLAARYQALVAQAMTNLSHPEWTAMKQDQRLKFLIRVTE